MRSHAEHVVFQEAKQVIIKEEVSDAIELRIVKSESLSNFSTPSNHFQPFTTYCFYCFADIWNPFTYFLEIEVAVPDLQLVRNFNASSVSVFNNFEITDFQLTTGTSCPRLFNSQLRHVYKAKILCFKLMCLYLSNHLSNFPSIIYQYNHLSSSIYHPSIICLVVRLPVCPSISPFFFSLSFSHVSSVHTVR